MLRKIYTAQCIECESYFCFALAGRYAAAKGNPGAAPALGGKRSMKVLQFLLHLAVGLVLSIIAFFRLVLRLLSFMYH